MEDKVAIYENTNIFLNSHNQQCVITTNENGSCKVTNATSFSLFGVFDGHCGVDCSQYVSTHLPLYLIQQSDFKLLNELANTESLNKMFVNSFKAINDRFTEKAIQEVTLLIFNWFYLKHDSSLEYFLNYK